MTRGRLEYPSGYSDFLLLIGKRSRLLWPSAWMPRPAPASWTTPRPASPWTPTPTSPTIYSGRRPGDGHLHDRDLRKGADTMAKRQKARQRQSDRRPPLGRAVFTRRAGRQAELPECLRPYPGRVRGEAESSDCRHESEKRNSRGCGSFPVCGISVVNQKHQKNRGTANTQKAKKRT